MQDNKIETNAALSFIQEGSLPKQEDTQMGYDLCAINNRGELTVLVDAIFESENETIWSVLSNEYLYSFCLRQWIKGGSLFDVLDDIIASPVDFQEANDQFFEGITLTSAKRVFSSMKETADNHQLPHDLIKATALNPLKTLLTKDSQ